MGDGEKAPLGLKFNPKIRLEFRGSAITSDAGLLAFRELDDVLGLTHIARDYLQESRTGRNIRHHLVPLLRQSIYSRLAGYDDTNPSQEGPNVFPKTRDAGTDRPASAGTRIGDGSDSRNDDDFEASSTQSRLPQGSDLGRDRRFWAPTDGREVVSHESGAIE